MKTPNISVIIPTHHPQYLDQVLQGLAAQEGDERFETILVENGGRLGEADRLVELYSKSLQPRYAYLVHANLNAARNHGCQMARGSICVLLDDDCIPEFDWVSRIASAFASKEGKSIIGGRCLLQLPDTTPHWLSGHLRMALSELDWGSKPRRIEEHEWLVGGNMGFPKRIFEISGKFDDSLGMRGRDSVQLGGDEYEFCVRAQKNLGVELFYDPNILVRHQISPSRTTIDYLQDRFYGQGLSVARIIGKQFSDTHHRQLKSSLREKVYDDRWLKLIADHGNRLDPNSQKLYLLAAAWCHIQFARGLLDGVESAEPDDSSDSAIFAATEENMDNVYCLWGSLIETCQSHRVSDWWSNIRQLINSSRKFQAEIMSILDS